MYIDQEWLPHPKSRNLYGAAGTRASRQNLVSAPFTDPARGTDDADYQRRGVRDRLSVGVLSGTTSKQVPLKRDGARTRRAGYRSWIWPVTAHTKVPPGLQRRDELLIWDPADRAVCLPWRQRAQPFRFLSADNIHLTHKEGSAATSDTQSRQDCWSAALLSCLLYIGRYRLTSTGVAPADRSPWVAAPPSAFQRSEAARGR